MGAKMVYQWSDGSQVNLDAQAVGERFEDIKRRHDGVLTAATIVEDARQKRSPLHSYFEWDDHVAGEKYREDQARYLIRHVVVRVSEPPARAPGDGRTSQSPQVRAFVRVSTPEKRGYVGIEEAMGDDEMRHQVLKRAWSELRGWQSRYKDLEEFSSVYSAIDRVQGSLELTD